MGELPRVVYLSTSGLKLKEAASRSASRSLMMLFAVSIETAIATLGLAFLYLITTLADATTIEILQLSIRSLINAPTGFLLGRFAK
jgi:hypothetical protein